MTTFVDARYFDNMLKTVFSCNSLVQLSDIWCFTVMVVVRLLLHCSLRSNLMLRTERCRFFQWYSSCYWVIERVWGYWKLIQHRNGIPSKATVPVDIAWSLPSKNDIHFMLSQNLVMYQVLIFCTGALPHVRYLFLLIFFFISVYFHKQCARTVGSALISPLLVGT